MVVFAVAVFAAVSKSLQKWNKLVFNGLIKSCSGWPSSRLTGVEGGVKMLLVFDKSIWFTLPPRRRGEAVLLNLWFYRKFA